MPIMAVMVWWLAKSDYFDKHWPFDSVSKFMKMCTYSVAKKSKFIAYDLIVMGCIVFIPKQKWLIIGKVCLHYLFLYRKIGGWISKQIYGSEISGNQHVSEVSDYISVWLVQVNEIVKTAHFCQFVIHRSCGMQIKCHVSII